MLNTVTTQKPRMPWIQWFKFAEHQMVPEYQIVNYFQVSAHGNDYYLSIVLIVNIGYTVGILLLDKDKRVFTSYTLLIPKQDLSVV